VGEVEIGVGKVMLVGCTGVNINININININNKADAKPFDFAGNKL
jgi:hypothetical protein